MTEKVDIRRARIEQFRLLTAVGDESFEEQARRLMADKLARFLVQSDAVVFEQHPSYTFGRAGVDVLATIGIVDPAATVDMLARIREHQDVVARRVYNNAETIIKAWEGEMIPKREAIHALSMAMTAAMDP